MTLKLNKRERTVMKYRKNPVVIEAIQYDFLNLQEIIDFVGEDLEYEIFDDQWYAGIAPPTALVGIKTLEGVMKVSEGDYVIKGVNGEFYPCKPDIFEKTYEAIDETDDELND